MPVAPELADTANARELGDAVILYEGMSLADLAHVVALAEAGVMPADEAGGLLAALLAVHPAPPLDFSLDPKIGDLFANRQAFLTMFTSAAGWLTAGRARREATTVAYRIAVRRRLLALGGALAGCVEALVQSAEAHRATLFPDYTYLQTAQPTVFGHYLLAFAYPLLRDMNRLRAAFIRNNLSPAGIGSLNGTRLPLDRARLAGLLGFDGLVLHARDAMWQADGPVELASLVVSMLTSLDRLAEDLQIYATHEFGLIELADEHSRSSLIMPQKKNPYALTYMRGAAREALGTLAAMVAVGQTPSGQPDNRIFAYGDVPRALDTAAGTARLMGAVIQGMQVNTQAAARRAAEGFSGATDVAEVLMQSASLDYRQAHAIVGQAVRDALAAGESVLTLARLDQAAESLIGRTTGLSAAEVAQTLDPEAIVATRTGPGGAAEAPMTAMLDECRAALAGHAAWLAETEGRLQAAEAMLGMTATALKRSPEPAPPPTDSMPSMNEEEARLRALEHLFDDLPVPPNRMRWDHLRRE